MGWDFDTVPRSKKEVVREITSNKYYNGDLYSEVLHYKVQGNEVWMIVHSIKDNDNYICLYLLSKMNRCWGYKFMDEGMHPYYYECPIEFLKLQPIVHNQEWRDKVFVKNLKEC